MIFLLLPRLGLFWSLYFLGIPECLKSSTDINSMHIIIHIRKDKEEMTENWEYLLQSFIK